MTIDAYGARLQSGSTGISQTSQKRHLFLGLIQDALYPTKTGGQRRINWGWGIWLRPDGTQTLPRVKLWLEIMGINLSNEQNLGCLGYIWDYITQSCGDYFINHDIRITVKLIKQPVQWKVTGFLSWLTWDSFVSQIGYVVMITVSDGNAIHVG